MLNSREILEKTIGAVRSNNVFNFLNTLMAALYWKYIIFSLFVTIK